MSSYADEKWQEKQKQYCHLNAHRQLEAELFEHDGGKAMLRPGFSTLKCFDDHGELFLGQLMALACSKDHLESGQVLVGALSKEQLNDEYKWELPSITSTNWTLLHISARCGSSRLAQLLLTHGHTIDAKGGADGWTSMHRASEMGHEKVVALLLQHGAEVNAVTKNGFTSIYVASANGHEKVVALLLQHGAEVNAVYKDGWTSMHVASDTGHEKVVALLLQHGAEVNAVTKIGSTSMHIASQNGHEKVVALLLQHGAEVNAVTKGGSTALTIASEHGHEKVVAKLLKHGAELNSVTKDGATALCYASWKGHEKVVAVLLQHGAEMNIVTKSGYSALDKASQEGHHECVSVLMEHMSKMYSYDKMMEIVEPGSEKARKNYNPRCLNYIEKFLYSKSLGSESEAATDISSRSGQIGLKQKCADVMTASQQDTGDIRDLFQSEEYRLVRMNLITYMDVEERHSAEGFSLITSRQLDHLSTVVGRRNHNRELFHMMEAGGPATIKKFSDTVLDSMGPNFAKYKATLDALLAKAAKQ